MGKSKNKTIRYKNLIKKTENWSAYLWRKLIGFDKTFTFRIKDFGRIEIARNMFGPFRENFFDKIYLRYIPKEVLANTPNPLIVDIGANVGFFSLAAFSEHPGAILYSFEPHPYCFGVLNEYHKNYSQFKWNIFNEAVSDSDKGIEMYSSTDSGFTTMSSVFQNNRKQHVIKAGSLRLDQMIEKNKIDIIDFIKIDCEGSEYAILYDLDKSIFSKIRSMCIETHRGTEDEHNAQSLKAFIQKMGYTTRMLEEDENIGYIWAWR